MCVGTLRPKDIARKGGIGIGIPNAKEIISLTFNTMLDIILRAS